MQKQNIGSGMQQGRRVEQWEIAVKLQFRICLKPSEFPAKVTVCLASLFLPFFFNPHVAWLISSQRNMNRFSCWRFCMCFMLAITIPEGNVFTRNLSYMIWCGELDELRACRTWIWEGSRGLCIPFSKPFYFAQVSFYPRVWGLGGGNKMSTVRVQTKVFPTWEGFEDLEFCHDRTPSRGPEVLASPLGLTFSCMLLRHCLG